MESKIIHPQVAFGAVMRVLIPGQPEVAFQEGYETTIADDDFFPVSLGISYPCPKHFNFTAHLFGELECIHEDQEHGRVIVSCDDGMGLMPHLIRTKADVAHLIEDLIKNRHFACYFGNDTAWEETLRHILTNDPVSLSLPDGARTYSDEFDMSRIGYWM